MSKPLEDSSHVERKDLSLLKRACLGTESPFWEKHGNGTFTKSYGLEVTRSKANKSGEHGHGYIK